jgi:3-hydroxymyristoyl/3-hydroxydecanoyl-(acyl carrier protein) dehydratase
MEHFRGYYCYRCFIAVNQVMVVIVNVAAILYQGNRVSLVEQELPNLQGHMSSSPVLGGVHVTRSLGLCVVYELVVCPFVFIL